MKAEMGPETNLALVGGAQPIILVPTFIDQIGPLNFMLNTGAAVSLVSVETARLLGLSSATPRAGTGLGGDLLLGLSRVRTLTVAGGTLEGVDVAITVGLRRIETIVGAKIDGAIGYNFLRRFRIAIDYRHRTVAMVAGGLAGESGVQTKQTSFTVGPPMLPHVLLPVLVNATGPYRFALDTGSSTTFLSPELAARLNIRGALTAGITGAGGKVQATGATVESMTVGSYTRRDLHVRLTDVVLQINQALGKRRIIHGIVGNNFLENLSVTIDYPKRTIQVA